MKKAVKDLQPGDIINYAPQSHVRCVVIDTQHEPDATVIVYQMRIGEGRDRVVNSFIRNENVQFDVEPRATPDELNALIQATRGFIAGDRAPIDERSALNNLVNRMSPPNPPTYEELLAALQPFDLGNNKAVEHEQFKSATDLIQRARNAGILK